MPSRDDLFSLRTIKRPGNSTDPAAWFDVQFYPYTVPDSPVFAVTGGKTILICRCLPQNENSIEILWTFTDEDAESSYNSVTWSRAPNGDPLVCVTGSNPKINVLHVKTGQLVTSFTGHGDSINDLAVSPADPSFVASASQDKSVRIWNLDPMYRKQPTAAIAFGEGHDEQVLALGWHRSGRYLLSGGMDTRVNLWVVPDNLTDRLGKDKPAILHYPHFSSTEVHTDYVDCVRFYNDIIVSRAAKENRILLWKIDGFTSDKPPPASVPIPPSQTVQSDKPFFMHTSQISGTRSAWGGRFQCLLQFDIPDSALFYMRFGLFDETGKNPVLGAGNTKGKLHFWDLQKLEDAGWKGEEVTKGDIKNRTALKSTLAARFREASITSNVSSAAQSTRSTPSTTSSTSTNTVGGPIHSSKKPGQGKASKGKREPFTGIGDPFKYMTPHKTVKTSKEPFAVRQVAFSTGGEWCVACGDHGMIAVLSRREDGFPEAGNVQNRAD